MTKRAGFTWAIIEYCGFGALMLGGGRLLGGSRDAMSFDGFIGGMAGIWLFYLLKNLDAYLVREISDRDQ